MTAEILTVAASTLISALVSFSKPLLEWYRTRNSAKLAQVEQQNSYKLKDTEQAFILYQKMVDTLLTSVETLSEDVRKMEAAHLACEQKNVELKVTYETQNAELKAEIKVLQEKVELLTNQLK